MEVKQKEFLECKIVILFFLLIIKMHPASVVAKIISTIYASMPAGTLPIGV